VTGKTQPLTKEGGSVVDATVSTDSLYMAYSTSAGSLRWLNVTNDDTTQFHNESVPVPANAANPRRYNPNPQPLRWSSAGKLLIAQAMPDNRARIGYTELISPFWVDLPPRPDLPEANDLPADSADYGCGSSAWSPDGLQLIWASGGPSSATCRFVSGLTLIDLSKNTSERIVAQEIAPDAQKPTDKIIAGADDPNWSADGQWIAFTMRDGVERTKEGQSYVISSLYRVRPDGENLMSLDEDGRKGWAACPLWIGDELYYIRGTYPENPVNSYGELYKVNPETLERSFVSSDVTCISNLSPDGRYAIIRRGDLSLRVWDVAAENDIFVTDVDSADSVKVAGWLPGES
jgi:WD40 repeat protein